MAARQISAKRSKYGKWSSETMLKALGSLRNGEMGLNECSRHFDIPKATLKRHNKGANKFANNDTKKMGRSSTLPHELELQLVEHILKLEGMFFGLSRKDCMSLAYQLAVQNGINHTFNSEKQAAGKEWFISFLLRHPSISLRHPESTSIARASGFNKASVDKFFELLTGLIDKYKFDANTIYNVDESGVTTVQKPQKILFKKGSTKSVLLKVLNGVLIQLLFAVSTLRGYMFLL